MIKINPDTILLRIDVKDTRNYNFKLLTKTKPDYVNYITMSADSDNVVTKIFVSCCQSYKKSEIRKWLKTGYSKIPFDYRS